MREFGLIGTVIWQSKKWKRLESDDARLAYFYLHTNRLSTSAGCYQLPEALALADLGWTEAKWRSAMAELVRVNLIEIDAAEACVYLVNFPRIVRPLGPSHLTGIFKLLAKVPSRALAAKMASEFRGLRPKLKLTLHNQNQNQKIQKKERGANAPPKKGARSSSLKHQSEAKLAVADWNNLANRHHPHLKPVLKLSATRTRALAARLDDCGGIEGWRAVLARAEASSFCLGNGARKWMIGFDWLLDETNLIKLMEGNYDDKRQTAGTLPPEFEDKLIVALDRYRGGKANQ